MKLNNKNKITISIILFYICVIIFLTNLFFIMMCINIPDLLKIIICSIFSFILGYMAGYMQRQKSASKELTELSKAMENYYTQDIPDLELGNLMFNTNTNQRYTCSEETIDKLKQIRTQLNYYMSDKEKWYDNPFDNTGNTFKNKVFEVQAYNWNDEINQDYNFKYKDIKISWYKHLGRDTTINKVITEEESKQMLEDCLNSLNKNKRKTHHN